MTPSYASRATGIGITLDSSRTMPPQPPRSVRPPLQRLAQPLARESSQKEHDAGVRRERLALVAAIDRFDLETGALQQKLGLEAVRVAEGPLHIVLGDRSGVGHQLVPGADC